MSDPSTPTRQAAAIPGLQIVIIHREPAPPAAGPIIEHEPVIIRP